MGYFCKLASPWMKKFCIVSPVIYTSRSSHRCSVKKLFLKVSQISQENTCVGVFFLIKLRTPNFDEHLRATFSVLRFFTTKRKFDDFLEYSCQ